MLKGWLPPRQAAANPVGAPPQPFDAPPEPSPFSPVYEQRSILVLVFVSPLLPTQQRQEQAS